MNQQQSHVRPATEGGVTRKRNDTTSSTTKFENELMSIPFFEAVRRENGISSITRLAVSMSKCHFAAGEEIYRSELNNRTFVYVLEGSVKLLGYQTSSKCSFELELSNCHSSVIAVLNAGSYFGHSEFISGCRITQAVAATPCQAILIPLATMYTSFRGRLFFPDLQEKLNFLSKVSLFEDIDSAAIERLVIASEVLRVAKGYKLYEEGMAASHLYVVLSGTFEILRKLEAGHSNSQKIHVSCVSEYQTLGAQDLFLGAGEYSETVHCTSFQGSLLKIVSEQFLSLIHNKKGVIRLCKSRENWKRRRVQKLEKTLSTQFPTQPTNRHQRILSSVSLTGKNRAVTEPIEFIEPLDFERCQSRGSHLTSKKVEFFRNEEEYLNHKYESMERATSAGNRYRGVFELKGSAVSRPSTRQHSRNMSQLVLTKFLTKKNKQQNRMIFQYLKTRPPELIFNSDKEFAIFKPLHVTGSAAVRNQKRSVARIKAKYFSQPLVPHVI